MFFPCGGAAARRVDEPGELNENMEKKRHTGAGSGCRPRTRRRALPRKNPKTKRTDENNGNGIFNVILPMLSSQTGDRTEASNRYAASVCAQHPKLLRQIADGLQGRDAKLAGDCAEVFAMVAEKLPQIVVPYFNLLFSALDHPNNKVRWEAMHAVALIAPLVPDQIVPMLARIEERMLHDASTIVRDYAIVCLGNVASCGEREAKTVFPMLKKGVERLNSKFLSKLLTAMTKAVQASLGLAVEALLYGYDYEHHAKSSVRQAARKLIKTAR